MRTAYTYFFCQFTNQNWINNCYNMMAKNFIFTCLVSLITFLNLFTFYIYRKVTDNNFLWPLLSWIVFDFFFFWFTAIMALTFDFDRLHQRSPLLYSKNIINRAMCAPIYNTSITLTWLSRTFHPHPHIQLILYLTAYLTIQRK